MDALHPRSHTGACAADAQADRVYQGDATLSMFSGPAREGSLCIKAVRRGRTEVPKPRCTQLLGTMASLAFGAELQKLQTALCRRPPSGELGLPELIASIAHELNQPLSAVGMHAAACRRWLEAEPPNLKKIQDSLRSITRDCERAADILGRIRDLSQRQPLPTAQVSMSELIRESAELLRGKVRQHGATLRVSTAGAALTVQGDRVQLQQVLVNLLSNALESLEGAQTRQVRIDARVREESVRVCIRDSGCGLTQQAAERMFDAYFTTKPGSMGLGLAICRSIIQQHGGRLWATPNPKGGTTFQFTLPLASEGCRSEPPGESAL